MTVQRHASPAPHGHVADAAEVHVYKYVGTMKKPVPSAEWTPEGGTTVTVGTADKK